jgi:hypothetical protein
MCHIYFSYSFVFSPLSNMSIFKKDCPECAASNSIDAVRCRCGYCFDPEALAGADADAYAEEQSRLYQDYLGARIVQAEAELTVAREQAKADPENTYQAAAALVAEQTLNALQAEMKQLTLRLAVKHPKGLTKHASTAPPARAVETKSAGSRPNPTPAVPHTATETHAPRSASRAVASPNRPDSVPPRPTPTVQRARALPPAIAKAAPKVATLETNKAAQLRSPAADKIRSAPVNRTATPVRPEPPRAPQSAKPGANFRKVQARKADAIAKSQAFAPVAKVKRALSSVVSALPTAPAHVASPKPAPARTATRDCPSCTATVASDLEKCRCGYVFSKAAEEMPAISLAVLKTAGKEATQECPSCTATVPVSRERCNCGYAFSKPTEQVPALALDATALAILTDGIKPTSTSRRR